jgi:pyruvate dehydrogenase E1 component alpha subunit/2-oxoisovalerate dehydrogenase E1 component alpha subunit
MATTARRLPADQHLRMLRGMLRVRVVDGRLLNMQRQGRIGFYGTATGEEAAVIGSAAALRDTDWIFSALRQGGALMYRGFPIAMHVAQCIGNSMDSLKGRQMPCHASAREFHVVSWSSVIGTQISQAAGAAMAARIRGDDTVIAGYLGDGATSSAEFHFGLNFAAVYDAPVVFICQNNQWAISVPLEKQTKVTEIAAKAEAYGMPGVRVDGNDVLAVYDATARAVERARSGKGPSLIECLTYRILGHSSSDDPTRYREDAEVEAWKEKDPIERYAAWLAEEGIVSDEERQEMEKELGEEVSAAIRSAEAAPPLAIESLFEDVYGETPRALSEQVKAVEGRAVGEGDPDAAFPL